MKKIKDFLFLGFAIGAGFSIAIAPLILCILNLNTWWLVLHVPTFILAVYVVTSLPTKKYPMSISALSR